MTVEYFTYESKNAPESKRWMAYISTPDVEHFWNIRFSAATEDAALMKAKVHYQSCEEDRNRTLKGREEARKRMQERMQKKMGAET